MTPARVRLQALARPRARRAIHVSVPERPRMARVRAQSIDRSDGPPPNDVAADKRAERSHASHPPLHQSSRRGSVYQESRS